MLKNGEPRYMPLRVKKICKSKAFGQPAHTLQRPNTHRPTSLLLRSHPTPMTSSAFHGAVNLMFCPLLHTEPSLCTANDQSSTPARAFSNRKHKSNTRARQIQHYTHHKPGNCLVACAGPCTCVSPNAKPSAMTPFLAIDVIVASKYATLVECVGACKNSFNRPHHTHHRTLTGASASADG